MINFVGFSFNNLVSYYLYLAFPISCVLFLTKNDGIDGASNICILSFGFFVGIVYTIVFHYLIPNGDNLLNYFGVNIFDMGTYGVRFSPLCDDPNYGTATIAIISALFFAIEKNKKQAIFGYAIITLNLALNLLSLSKMFIICIIIVLVTGLIRFVYQSRAVLLSLGLFTFLILGVLIFLSTSYGNTLLIRFIGTKDGISLNRITSGRVDLFGEYSSYILSHPFTLLFGKGPLYTNLSIFFSGEHNTFTKNIFGNGLLGTTIMLYVLFLMTKERFYNTSRIPTNPSFFGFILVLLVCCMSLCIAPSTVFPIVVLSAQFVSFLAIKEKTTILKDDIILEISI